MAAASTLSEPISALQQKAGKLFTRSFWFCISYNCKYPQISTPGAGQDRMGLEALTGAGQWSRLFVGQLYNQLNTSQPAAEIHSFAMHVCYTVGQNRDYWLLWTSLISCYQLGIGCQFAKAHTSEFPGTNQKTLCDLRYLLQNLILVIFLFYSTILSCLEAKRIFSI